MVNNSNFVCEHPLISIIVPSYNHAQYLDARIQSILRQTYQNFEILVLDDYSTDSSWSYLNQYINHPKFSHIIQSEMNSGSPYKQWEKGIQLAKGEWIWIAESDDWAETTFLEVLISNILPNTTLAFCHSHIDSNESSKNDCNGTLVSLHWRGIPFIKRRMLSFNSIINASMAIFKKDVLESNVFEVRNSLTYCFDWYFWTLIASKGDVLEISNRLNHFRIHPGKLSNSADKNGLNISEACLIWKITKKKFSLTPTLAQKLHFLLRWILSVPRFNHGIEHIVLKRVQRDERLLVILYRVTRPLHPLIRVLYHSIK